MWLYTAEGSKKAASRAPRLKVMLCWAGTRWDRVSEARRHFRYSIYGQHWLGLSTDSSNLASCLQHSRPLNSPDVFLATRFCPHLPAFYFFPRKWTHCTIHQFQSSVIALEITRKGALCNSIHWIPSSNDPQVLLWGIR